MANLNKSIHTREIKMKRIHKNYLLVSYTVGHLFIFKVHLHNSILMIHSNLKQLFITIQDICFTTVYIQHIF